jgi:hypothetical protein
MVVGQTKRRKEDNIDLRSFLGMYLVYKVERIKKEASAMAIQIYTLNI